MSPAPSKSCFKTVNGIEHFDNGVSRIWFCPTCRWWMEEKADECPTCKTKRDGKS